MARAKTPVSTFIAEPAARAPPFSGEGRPWGAGRDPVGETPVRFRARTTEVRARGRGAAGSLSATTLDSVSSLGGQFVQDYGEAMRSKSRTGKRSALLACGVILAGLLFLGLAITPPPSPALADEIDRLLEQDPCVRSPDRWPARYYVWEKPSWAKHPGRHIFWVLSGPWLGSDTSKVSVRFHERASAEMYTPGRHLLRADEEQLWLDSSNDMLVTGTYDIGSRKLISWTCGPGG